MDASTVISLANVRKSYGDHQVLKDVTLDIKKGEIFGLVGRNGAGKTTIFKAILGLTNIESGTLAIDGETTQTGLAHARHNIGFLIGENFFRGMNAQQNLRYQCRLRGINAKGEIERVLDIVDLHPGNKKFGSFSMGMKQRLGIANAILGNPEVLILDEPTNGLDPQGIADIRELIHRLNREFGMTVVVSSHILPELEHTATRFGIVHGGCIEREVTREELASAGDAVRVSVDDAQKAVRILGDAGIRVLGTAKDGMTLEDFYFDVVHRDAEASSPVASGNPMGGAGAGDTAHGRHAAQTDVMGGTR